MLQEKGMTQISSITSRILDLPPSCIEFSLLRPDYFAVGTYQLERLDANAEGGEELGEEGEEDVRERKESLAQKRNGSVILFKLENDEIRLVYTLATDFAILDLHFHPHSTAAVVDGEGNGNGNGNGIGNGNGLNQFVTANSTGSFSLCRIVHGGEGDEEASVEQDAVCQLWDESILVLSFTWHPSIPNLIGATLSTGDVVLCKVDSKRCEISNPVVIASHSLEAWTIAFGAERNITFSGGDDAALKRIILPDSLFANDQSLAPDSDERSSCVQWSNRKIHNAGVTAILPLTEDFVLTGSYDDNIRIIQVKDRPVCSATLNLQGGVWKLKQISNTQASDQKDINRFIVLASCMHAGARILEINLDTAVPSIKILATFEEHGSMNYGSDVQAGGHLSARHTIVSTSFYDELLCLWRFQE